MFFPHETATCEVPVVSTKRPLSQTVNLRSSAPRALITDGVQCDAREAPDPAAPPRGPASFFYGNCLLADVFIFFPSFHVCCIYLNIIRIKLEAATQAENSDTVVTSRLDHLL